MIHKEPDHITRIKSVLNGVLACFACFTSHVLEGLACFTCFMCSRALWTWRAYVLFVLCKMACLACFKKWRVWRASKNGVLGVLHKIVCLELLNYFLGVFDNGTLVNCRFWMQSDVFNGRQEIVKATITIFVFVLNFEFLVWI